MTALRTIPKLIGGAGILVAAAIPLTAAIGLTSGIAGAEKIWDLGEYDSCMAKADSRFIMEVTNAAQHAEEVKWCCVMSGGQLSSSQGCVAAAVVTQVPNGTLPPVATNAPVTTAPGSRAPGRLPSGGVAAP
jgi:hypothetical protein